VEGHEWVWEGHERTAEGRDGRGSEGGLWKALKKGSQGCGRPSEGSGFQQAQASHEASALR